jgi:hypothetical protein
MGRQNPGDVSLDLETAQALIQTPKSVEANATGVWTPPTINAGNATSKKIDVVCRLLNANACTRLRNS